MSVLHHFDHWDVAMPVEVDLPAIVRHHPMDDTQALAWAAITLTLSNQPVLDNPYIFLSRRHVRTLAPNDTRPPVFSVRRVLHERLFLTDQDGRHHDVSHALWSVFCAPTSDGPQQGANAAAQAYATLVRDLSPPSPGPMAQEIRCEWWLVLSLLAALRATASTMPGPALLNALADTVSRHRRARLGIRHGPTGPTQMPLAHLFHGGCMRWDGPLTTHFHTTPQFDAILAHVPAPWRAMGDTMAPMLAQADQEVALFLHHLVLLEHAQQMGMRAKDLPEVVHVNGHRQMQARRILHHATALIEAMDLAYLS